jgi:cob(I)alamin adenosyltransferase
MTKIYTRTGDAGETGLFGGGRVRKDDPRVATCGAVDELNAALGVARAEVARMKPVSEAVDDFLAAVQHELFNLGAELATPNAGRYEMQLVQDADIARLEAAIDQWESELAPLEEFILPGGRAAARRGAALYQPAERRTLRVGPYIEPVGGRAGCRLATRDLGLGRLRRRFVGFFSRLGFTTRAGNRNLSGGS